jgi:hypothetical protein
VGRFAELPERFGFAIEYADAVGSPRYDEPDFVAAVAGGRTTSLRRRGWET